MPELLFDRSNNLVYVERELRLRDWDEGAFTVTIDRTLSTFPFRVYFNKKEPANA